MTRLRQAIAAALVIALATGCGSTEPAAGPPPAIGETTAPLVLTPAAGTPVVTFNGLVNGGQPLAADLAALDALPTQSVTVLEPFVLQTVTFTGAGFADLLDAAEATGTSITVHALDDYEVTFDAAVLREPGVILATKADGEPIDGASGGPVRLIFPDTSESGKNSDLWVWSIDQITVE